MDLLDLFTILCILIPGAYCAVIDINFGLRRKLSVRELFINIALFNFAIAMILWLIYWGLSWNFSYFDFVDNTDGFVRSDLKDEIAISAGLAIVISQIWLYIADKRWIFKYLIAIKATRRTQEDEIWRYAHSRENLEFEFCDYYDFKNELVYKGGVKAYSDRVGVREILLIDVEVFDLDENLLDKRPYIYLAFPEDQVRLDFYNKGEKHNVTT